MATFKVGQRVRLVKSVLGNTGAECVVTALAAEGYWSQIGEYVGIEIKIDGSDERYVAPDESWLAPLTDPKADEFIERIKKLAREPVGTKQKQDA